MKTAYVLTSYPCLSETFARQEIEGLRKAGEEIEILAADGEERVEGCAYRPRRWSWCAAASMLYMLRVYPLAPIRYLGILARFLFSCPREALTLLGNVHTVAFFCKRLDERKIAHVHAYFLSWPACIGLAVARISGRSFSIGAHSRDIFVENGAAEYKVRNAVFVTVCSQQGLEHLKRILPPCHHHKLRLVRHWVEWGATPLPVKEGGSKQTRVTAIGRLVRKKGFEYLVRAWREVVKACPDTELVIVGEGPEEGRLKELAGELGIEDNVRLMGRREHREVMGLLAESSVLVVPSVVSEDGDRDGIPNVILEAFACGAAVVASGLAGIAEAVEHNETGLLVRPGNAEELAAAIRMLLKDEGVRRRLTEKAKRVVGQRFDGEANARTLSEIFAGLD